MENKLMEVMKDWYNSYCNNDCEGCGFHSHCQRVLDIFNNTNYAEKENKK